MDPWSQGVELKGGSGGGSFFIFEKAVMRRYAGNPYARKGLIC